MDLVTEADGEEGEELREVVVLPGEVDVEVHEAGANLERKAVPKPSLYVYKGAGIHHQSSGKI